MAEQFVDRVSKYPGRFKITREDGTTEYVTLERADEPTVAGTPLNAATFNAMINHIHTAGDVTSGTFAAARIPNISMSKGGTGATNGSDGLKNLLAAGPMILKEGTGYQYGDTLPPAGNKGRIFFKKVTE